MKPLLVVAVALAALALPVTASAGLTTITFASVPTQGERTLSATPGRFDLVGLRWHGSGAVSLSVRSESGRWGPWLDAAPEEDDQPDRGSRESIASRGWRVGNPIWVGPSTAIRYRISGRVRDLRASFVRSPEQRIPLRAVASAGLPPIVARSSWGADESIVKGAPSYAPAIRFASVHHTAGPNDYSPSQVAAILRGIQAYHVKSNGWNDIGYNFLVDRFGTVYEGRAGGIDRNVVGAHIRGFNTGSVGVALIGTFGTTGPPAAATDALEKLLAWRLDLAHVDPLSTATLVSAGSERYVAGTAVPLRAVSGHRDTGLTSCPGDLLYARLGAIATRSQAMGLPKIYDPVVSGGIGGRVRFVARLSGAVAWKLTVSDVAGRQLAAGSGQSQAVDWTWDATLAAVTGARWKLEVAGATPAAGTLGKVSTSPLPVGPLVIGGAAADPPTISPNGDGEADTTTISYTTNADATVSATLLDRNGVQLLELSPAVRMSAGTHTLVFDGLGQPDGVYTVVLAAVGAAGVAVTQQLTVAISRTLGAAVLASGLVTPNGDGVGDELAISFELAAPATVRLRVLHEGAWVATPFTGLLGAGAQRVAWDGSKRVGTAPDGAYDAILEATDAVGTTQVTLPFVLDARAPVVKLLARPLRLWVSEAATLTISVNGSRRRLTTTEPGFVPLTGIRTVRSILVVARDTARNVTILRRP